MAFDQQRIRTRRDVRRQRLDYLLRRHTYSNAKARTMLGWEPKIDLGEGMDRCETWLRESGLLDG